MAECKFITMDDVSKFSHDGFLAVRKMYSLEEVQRLAVAIDLLAGLPPTRGKQMVYYEESLMEKGNKVLSRIEKFVEVQKELAELACAEKIIGRVSQLLGEPPVLFKEKINFKLPGGSGFAPHQDIQPGWDEYASYFISVAVTIDEHTEENGCLEMASGHHKRGLIGKKWKPLEGDELKGLDFVKYPTRPGDVLIFDCFAPHQSAPNFTTQQRRSIYLSYNRRSEGNHRVRYFDDKRKSFPPDCERESGKAYYFSV